MDGAGGSVRPGTTQVHRFTESRRIVPYAENTLTLDTKYNPPDNPWLLLIVGVAIVAFVALGVLAGVGPAAGGAVAGGIGGSYGARRVLRRRNIRVDLDKDASEVVVDEESRRMAFLTTIAGKTGWRLSSKSMMAFQRCRRQSKRSWGPSAGPVESHEPIGRSSWSSW